MQNRSAFFSFGRGEKEGERSLPAIFLTTVKNKLMRVDVIRSSFLMTRDCKGLRKQKMLLGYTEAKGTRGAKRV